jgi:ComF family protein
MVQAVKYLATSVLDLLYPPHCAVCERALDAHAFVCAECVQKIERPRPPLCRCGSSLLEDRDICADCAGRRWYFEKVRSFGFYGEENVLGSLIKAFKYGGERALVHPLTDFLIELAAELREEIQAVTFIPMTRAKERERGFNQAELLARQFAKRLDLPVCAALEKIRETPAQASLSGPARRSNLEGAFALATFPACANIVLIDDVITTGTTAETASRVLRAGGYTKVWVLTLARVRRPQNENLGDGVGHAG